MEKRINIGPITLHNLFIFSRVKFKVLARRLQTVDVRVTSMEMIAAKRKTTSKLAYNMVQKLTLIEQADHSMKMFDDKARFSSDLIFVMNRP